MASYLKYCLECAKRGKIFPFMKIAGYITYLNDECMECLFCGAELLELPMLEDDFRVLQNISPEKSFIEAMMKLHDEDIIEYNLKMSQFRTQVQLQEAADDSDKPQCPKCGSRNITTGQRGYGLFSGFVGSDMTVNRCANCGFSWKPGLG